MTAFCNAQIPILSGTSVFTAGLALLAFVIALYSLAAREQKTPYIANSVYSTALIVLAAILLSALGQVVNAGKGCIANILSMISGGFLGIGVVLVFLRVWHAQNRKINFRDDHLVKNLRVIRWVKSFRQSHNQHPTYEHDPVGLRAYPNT